MDKKRKHIFAALSGTVCLVVYVLTLHPSVGFIDCGELAAVCYTFGVPHPTGYPLFLVLGYIVSHLPLPGTIIYRLNLLSAIESSAAVVITFYSAVIILENIFTKKKNEGKRSAKKEKLPALQPSEVHVYLISFFTAVSSGLVKTVWFDATQIEVYALHTLFISILFYFLLRILFTIDKPSAKNWAFLFLFFGLSAANHSTTIYFIPVVLYLFYIQNKRNNVFAKSLLKYIFLVIPGALMYLILVYTASLQPYLNWSNPQNIGNLIEHLRGSDFSQLMFSSSNVFSTNAAAFSKDLPGEMAIVSGVFGCIGLISIWKNEKNLFIISILLILTSLLYSFNYNTAEINSFYLAAYYVISLSASVGYVSSFAYLGKSSMVTAVKPAPVVIAAGLIICSFTIWYNYRENDNSSNYINEDITLNTLNSLKPNSVLFTYDYAFVYSSSLYFQQVEKVRPDVKVFMIKFLSVPWYLESIKKYYPDVYEPISVEAEDYINSYKGAENIRVQKLSNLVEAIIYKTQKKFLVYITIDVVLAKDLKTMFSGYTEQPDGLVYRLREKNADYDPEAGKTVLGSVFRKYEPVGYHKNRMFVSTPGLFYETAYYHFSNGNNAMAMKFLDKALDFNKNFTDAVNLKNKILSEQKK